LNTDNESLPMTDARSEFQTDGAAHRKERFAKSVRANGWMSSGVADERSVRALTRRLMRWLRYRGTDVFRVLCQHRHLVVNSVLSLHRLGSYLFYPDYLSIIRIVHIDTIRNNYKSTIKPLKLVEKRNNHDHFQSFCLLHCLSSDFVISDHIIDLFTYLLL